LSAKAGSELTLSSEQPLSMFHLSFIWAKTLLTFS
jgi:hypothetical protein